MTTRTSTKRNVNTDIELWQFCEQYNIKPPHSPREIAIWRLVYGSTGLDTCFVTYLGTFAEATKKLYCLALRNNTHMPSSSGYSCKFVGFRIEHTCSKISPEVARMIASAGGYVRGENVDE